MTNLTAQSLRSLELRLDTFYGRHISGIHSHMDAWEFQLKLREIEREYDRIVGYRRGFREAMIEVEMPLAVGTDIAFVLKATATLGAELDALATACDTASRGRPKKDRIDPTDRRLALRARELQSSHSLTLSLRKAILQAIREHEAIEPLPITTTVEGHVRRIRRVVNSDLLSSSQSVTT